jgi:hypothetical protein
MSALDTTLIHTCTLEKRSASSGTADSWGQGTETWKPVVTLRCRWVLPKPGPAPDTVSEEGLMGGRLVMGFRIDLATPGASTRYRVRHIQGERGRLIDEGPLNIREVINPGYLDDHLELILARERDVTALVQK